MTSAYEGWDGDKSSFQSYQMPHRGPPPHVSWFRNDLGDHWECFAKNVKTEERWASCFDLATRIGTFSRLEATVVTTCCI